MKHRHIYIFVSLCDCIYEYLPMYKYIFVSRGFLFVNNIPISFMVLRGVLFGHL